MRIILAVQILEISFDEKGFLYSQLRVLLEISDDIIKLYHHLLRRLYIFFVYYVENYTEDFKVLNQLCIPQTNPS